MRYIILAEIWMGIIGKEESVKKIYALYTREIL